jgi:hypothetical protein
LQKDINKLWYLWRRERKLVLQLEENEMKKISSGSNKPKKSENNQVKKRD